MSELLKIESIIKSINSALPIFKALREKDYLCPLRFLLVFRLNESNFEYTDSLNPDLKKT